MTRRWLRYQRWRLRRREFAEPLGSLIRNSNPLPDAPFAEVEFVALDIETTSLDAAKAEMLSVGWVLIRHGRVDLSTAESHVVRPAGQVGSSASVHGLTDTTVKAGEDWGIVLDKIVEVLTGRALLVHHAGLDKGLLDRLCKTRFGIPLPVPVVDTLALEHRRQRRRYHVGDRQSLRLPEVRAAYHLPRYSAHNCLVDAVAAAELLIAMVAHNHGAEATCLRDL